METPSTPIGDCMTQISIATRTNDGSTYLANGKLYFQNVSIRKTEISVGNSTTVSIVKYMAISLSARAFLCSIDNHQQRNRVAIKYNDCTCDVDEYEEFKENGKERSKCSWRLISD